MKSKRDGIYKSIYGNKLYTTFYVFDISPYKDSNFYKYTNEVMCKGDLFSKNATILNLACVNEIFKYNYAETLTRLDVVISFKNAVKIDDIVEEINTMNIFGNSIDEVVFADEKIEICNDRTTETKIKAVDYIPYENLENRDIKLEVTHRNGKISYGRDIIEIFDHVEYNSRILDTISSESNVLTIVWYKNKNKLIVNRIKNLTDINIKLRCKNRFDVRNSRFYEYSTTNILTSNKVCGLLGSKDIKRIYAKRISDIMFPSPIILNNPDAYLLLFRDTESKMSDLVLELLENMCLDGRLETYQSILKSIYVTIKSYIEDRYKYNSNRHDDSYMIRHHHKSCRLHEYLEMIFNNVCEQMGISYRLDLFNYRFYTTEELIKLILFNDSNIPLEDEIEMFMMRLSYINPRYAAYTQNYSFKYDSSVFYDIEKTLIINKLIINDNS